MPDGRHHTQQAKARADQLSADVIGAAIKVHSALGPGLLESVYEVCLASELLLRGIKCRRQVAFPVTYKGRMIDGSYRVDLLVEDLVVVELKAVDQLEPIHYSQLLTYLRLADRWLGLLINFNTVWLKQGLSRVLNH
jgi:GxxExxY protein